MVSFGTFVQLFFKCRDASQVHTLLPGPCWALDSSPCYTCRQSIIDMTLLFSFSTVLAACDKGCRNCVDGNCLACKAGFELDQGSKQCEKKKGKSNILKRPRHHSPLRHCWGKSSLFSKLEGQWIRNFNYFLKREKQMFMYQRLDQNYLLGTLCIIGFFFRSAIECGGDALGWAAGRHVFGL